MSTTELPRPAESLQEELQRKRAEQQEHTIEKLPLPGYGGRLVGHYHLITYKAQRRIAKRNSTVRGKDKEDTEAVQELYNAADTLVAACDHIEACVPSDASSERRTDAETFNAEGHKLNAEFAEYLGLHDPKEESRQGKLTNRAALFLIIPNETHIVVHAGQLMGKQGAMDEEIDEEQLGESDAVS